MKVTSWLLNAYPRVTGRSSFLPHKTFLDSFGNVKAGDKVDADVVIRGRLTSRRSSGQQLFFLDTWSDGQKLQVVGSDASSAVQSVFRELKRGDHIEVSGTPGRTQKGELSIYAREMTILTHCKHRIPEQYTDYAKRMSNRHIDFLVNPTSRDVIVKRSKIISTLRHELDKRGFLELETPILQTSASGAAARPFETKALIGLDMQLKIAPELALKRAVVSGFGKVYEIGKSFRNEGLSRRHNPEFTTLEFYEAYSGIEDLIELTKSLLVSVEEALGTPMNQRLFHPDSFKRLDFVKTIERAINAPLPQDQPSLLALCESLGMEELEDTSMANLYDLLATKYIEPLCARPTFVTDLPAALSPLAKSTGHIAHRFEMYINKMELVNAYEEENDPAVQREKFMAQNSGTLTPEEDDYCRALEWGLPPTGGFGMGIDRLVMLLTGVRNISETLLLGGIMHQPKAKPNKEGASHE